MYAILLNVIFTMIISFCLTPIVRWVSIKVGAVDEPNSRRINTVTMPSSGGIAIYSAYFFSAFFLLPIDHQALWPVFIGATIVVLTGLVDDIKNISPLMKIIGLLLAALVIYYMGGIRASMIEIPFIGGVDLGVFSLPLTILWILGITNAVNLIDGLDGLASGVSAISLVTMGIIAYFFLISNNVVVSMMIFTLVAAILGFLPFNYYPAKIYLGDTGALFLGFMISVLSLYGLKNVTFITFIVPIVILGVPITDTLYAIIRRKLNKRPISSADNQHIHHRLMALGFSHKQSVKIIYTLTFVFSLISLLYPVASTLSSILITLSLILALQLLAEMIGLVGIKNQPLLNTLRKMGRKLNRKKTPKDD